jgi:hypothetical protein
MLLIKMQLQSLIMDPAMIYLVMFDRFSVIMWLLTPQENILVMMAAKKCSVMNFGI